MTSLYHATAAAFLAFATMPPESATVAPVIEQAPKIEVAAPVAMPQGGLRIGAKRAIKGDAQD